MSNSSSLRTQFCHIADPKKARCAGFLALLLAPFAQATDHQPTYPSSLSIFAQRSDHEFTEYGEDDFVWNRELGSIDHFGLALRWQLDSGVFMAVEAERGKASLEYRGFDQVLNYIEHRTEYLITEQHLRLGRQFGNNEAHIGIGSHYRERNIVNGNLYEELDWRFASFGLAKRLALGNRWQLKLFGEVGLALDSQMRIEFAGKLDPVTIVPGRISSSEAGVELLFKATPKFTISLTPTYKFTLVEQGGEYPVSQEGEPFGTASQPKTEYETLALELRLSKMF